MGCGCSGSGGGGGASSSTYRVRPPARPAPGEYWEVTYPNGQVARLDAEWQAKHAVAVAGGSWRHITSSE